MRAVLTLLGKDIAHLLKNRMGLTITFLVPALLIYLFGSVFGLNRKDSGPVGIPLAVVDASHTPAAAKLVAALKAESAFRVVDTIRDGAGVARPLTEADARVGLKDNQYHFAIILPADLLPDDGFGVHIKFLSNPRNDMETQMVNGMLQKTVFSNVPELLGQSLQKQARRQLGDAGFERFNRTIANTVAESFGGNPDEIYRRSIAGDLGFSDLGRLQSSPKPAAAAAGAPPAPAGIAASPGLRRLDQTPAAARNAGSGAAQATGPAATAASPAAPPAATVSSSSAADLFSRIVRIETEQVAGKQVKNPMATRLVGGYAIMFLLFAVSASSASLFDEKNAGLFQRLLSAPIRRAHILWAKFLYGTLLGLVQISILFVVGRLLYGIEIEQHLVPLLIVSLCAAAACSSFGMLLAAVSSSPAAANGLATLVILTMSSVGGAWIPISWMPEFLQKMSRLTIVYWSIEAFSDVLWAGMSLYEVLPKIGILAGIAAGVMAIAVWRFNRSRIFD